jgi:ABC-type sugar transport system ATPase subunit
LRQGTFELNRVSFDIAAGWVGILMGRTGSGKTSILESICGLRRPRSGRIIVNGRDVTRLRSAERGLGYVPQDAALFPTMTVRDHLAFALRIRGWSRDEIQNRIDPLAQLLEIGHLMSRTPHGLSGGETQRVALGRAISFRPSVLLMDEPFGSLDEETKQHMYAVIARVREHHDVTILHVTHSSAEAETLGDLILRIEKGVVVQCKGPESPVAVSAGNGNGAP